MARHHLHIKLLLALFHRYLQMVYEYNATGGAEHGCADAGADPDDPAAAAGPEPAPLVRHVRAAHPGPDHVARPRGRGTRGWWKVHC